MSASVEQELKDYLFIEFARYLTTCKTILDRHVFSEDAQIEMSAAAESFSETIANVSLPDCDFATYIKKIAELKNTDSDYDVADIIELIPQEDIIAEAKNTAGYAVIKLSSISDGEKLIEFVNKEIYPYSIGGKSQFNLYED